MPDEDASVLKPKIHVLEDKLKDPSTLFLNKPAVTEEKK